MPWNLRLTKKAAWLLPFEINLYKIQLDNQAMFTFLDENEFSPFFR